MGNDSKNPNLISSNGLKGCNCKQLRGRPVAVFQVAVNNPVRAASVIAETAGCLIRRSAEMA